MLEQKEGGKNVLSQKKKEEELSTVLKELLNYLD